MRHKSKGHGSERYRQMGENEQREERVWPRGIKKNAVSMAEHLTTRGQRGEEMVWDLDKSLESMATPTSVTEA